MIGALIERVTALVLRRPKTILLIAAAFVVVAALLATRLKLDPDVLNLIPRNNREVNEFRSLITETGTLDFHVIVIEFPKGAEPAAYGPLLDAIGQRLQSSPRMQTVTWKVPDPFSLVGKVLPYSMLVLDPAQLNGVAAKLSDQNIRAAVERNKSLLQTPQSTAVKKIVQIDPFNLLPIYLDKLQGAGGSLKVDFSSGYYVASDQSSAIIIAKPRQAAQELPFSRAVMEDSNAIIEKSVGEFRTAHSDLPLPAIGFTGGYAIAAADEKIIRQDMTINSITSIAGVLLLYLYAFRRPSALVYSGVPMASAIIITFGIGSIAYGTLSAASTGFAALVAGLGVDFMTVLYERYVDERNRGGSVIEAVQTMMHHTLPGVVVGALTTAATFYAFLATDFRGMTELGFLTGSGILVFLFCVVFVFPALLVVNEKRREGRRTLQIHGFGSTPLVRFSLARPRVVILVWTVLVIISAVLATKVQFSDDLRNLRSKGNEGVRLQELVTEKFGQTFESMMYGVEAPTAAEAVARTHQVVPDLEQAKRNGAIGSFQSIASFLPSEATQGVVISRLAASAGDEFSFPRIERTFRAALVENGFREDAYDGYLESFRQALAQREPISMATIERLGLTGATDRYIRKTKKGYMSIAYVYPAAKVWPRNLPEELQEFRRKHPEGVLTGVNLISQTLRTIVLRDAIRASLIGFVVVFALLWIGFRSFTRAGLVFVPFVAGCTCMLGFMGVFGLKFNFMNIFIGLMLVGTATDYAVYMLQRYDESPSDFPENGLEVARAVVLAALMSIVGFASFSISHYPGVRSMGYAATFGIALSCLASITLLPAMLSTGRFRHRRASMLGEPEPDE